MTEKELKVGIGDMKFTRGEGSTTTCALGFCIGIAFYDSFIYLGALLYTMLPSQFSYNSINAFKYAGLGIRGAIRRSTVFGMIRPKVVVKIAGGVKTFEISGNVDFENIGIRNIVSTGRVLLGEGTCIAAGDTGGSYARTMKLDLFTGSVTIGAFGRSEKVL